MPLSVTAGGVTVRSDDLTLDALLALERQAGKPWPELNPYASARDALLLVLAMLDAAGVADRASVAKALPADASQWLVPVGDDLPEMYRDGMPSLGGRSFDDYIVAFGNPRGWGWPPDVTRRQRVRDLDLLLDALDG